MSLAGKNLLDAPEPTYLEEEPEVLARIAAGDEGEDLVKAFPKSSLAWSVIAGDALEQGYLVEGYAYARVGYHRGLDALRAHGWKGHGPVPYSHEPNRGFLTCLHLLGQAAAAIGEDDEAHRIDAFLHDADPTAQGQLGG
ncbi:hypothetical protein BK826_07630 [Rothia kristinae]|uniref:DUF3151 domain-containing protein n=1 Tax=Rothia kristinae TaxID=37923 RepID=A0A1S2N1K5_9MICC|nr:DUF3151 domain-containing protein [Rothia kristinae]OIJ35581.1 hypothetical protein BK826_07630 [Rothia kristinae]